MLKLFDVLGRAKWPSLLLIVVFPLLAYQLGDWAGTWEGRAQALYGPTSAGGVALLVSHPARERPRAEPTRWTVRFDEQASARVAKVQIRYAEEGMQPPGEGWQPLDALYRWGWSGELAPPSHPTSALHLWLAVELDDGTTHHRAWPLDAPR